MNMTDEAQILLRSYHSPEGKKAPERLFYRLRELAPVFRDQDSGMLYLLRWEDCDLVMRSPMFGTPHLLELEPRFARSDALQFLADALSNIDPPRHTRLRGAVQKSFSAPVLKRSADYVRQVIDETIADLRGQDRFDIVRDYAGRIPNTVICEMLGVPREDHDRFGGWLAQQFRLLSPMPPPDSVVAEVDAATRALLDYMGDLVDERRKRPRTDIISGIIAAQETSDDPLTTREMIVTASILLAGGSDTTKTTIAIGARQLLHHPDQLEALLDQPDLMPSAFEEIARTAGPVVLANARRALEDVTLGDLTIAKDDMVVPVLAGANFDPAKFDDPFAFDIRRNPNRHLAFGGGVHVCIGNMMARLVGGEAILSLMRAFPHMDMLDDGYDVNVDLIALRGLNSLPVRVGS